VDQNKGENENEDGTKDSVAELVKLCADVQTKCTGTTLNETTTKCPAMTGCKKDGDKCVFAPEEGCECSSAAVAGVVLAFVAALL
jgi:hypothetical protein